MFILFIVTNEIQEGGLYEKEFIILINFDSFSYGLSWL